MQSGHSTSPLTDVLTTHNLTGILNRNSPESNRQAVREMLARNSYWTFDAERIIELELDYPRAATIMARRLGLSLERFQSDETPFIDPNLTTDGLITSLTKLEEAARNGGRIMFATAHPGSLMGFYYELAQYVLRLGAQVITPDEPIAAPDNRWIDSVGGVNVLSNEGDLNHTHADMGMKEALLQLKPDLFMGDHGFAMAAINLRIPTIAIFDVDDPALAMMAEFEPKLIHAVPMNDNQTNTRSAAAAKSLIESRHA